MCKDHTDHHHREDENHGTVGLGRRGLLVTGAAAALTLSTVSFASAAPAGGDGTGALGTGALGTGTGTGEEQTRTVTGTLPTGSPDFVYLPVEVPRGVSEIHVSYSYERPQMPAGDPGQRPRHRHLRRTRHGPRRTRLPRWSGGARTEFFLRADAASPGYVPGPVRAGTWHIALGPYTVAPQGLAYQVTITLRFGDPGRTPAPVHPPERAKGRGRAWYRGDCHIHSVHSDGRRTPAEFAALARAMRPRLHQHQ